jgi:hypothetical protein
MLMSRMLYSKIVLNIRLMKMIYSVKTYPEESTFRTASRISKSGSYSTDGSSIVS